MTKERLDNVSASQHACMFAFSNCAICSVDSKLYNKLVKMRRPCPVSDETLGEPPRPKPVLTSYLLGWGVAVILCGISGAINWINYAQEH